MTTPKYKHFKFEDRYVIQEFLRLNYSFTAIANRLKKDRRAVSKEILKHRFLKVGANKRKLDCTKPDKPPYVCNGCLNKTSCKQNQYIYEASIAQNEYEKTLRQERSRLQVSKETIAAINDIIVPLMTEKHHSVNHVFAAHPELLPMSTITQEPKPKTMVLSSVVSTVTFRISLSITLMLPSLKWIPLSAPKAEKAESVFLHFYSVPLILWLSRF